MFKNNLTAEWKNSQKITIEIDNPITEEIDRYHVTLRAEMIDKMLYRAFSYSCPWVEKVEVLEDEHYGDCNSEQVTRGGSLILYDRYNNQTCHILDLEGVLSGFYQAFAKFLILCMYTNERLVFSLSDTKTVDEIIQYALFNEVRYPHKEDDGGNYE